MQKATRFNEDANRLDLKQATTQRLFGRMLRVGGGAAAEWNGRAVRFDSG